MPLPVEGRATTLLERAFGVRPEERRLVLLFFAFFAGVGMFYTVGAAIGDTLFLSHLPVSAVPSLLPWVYVGIAVANVVSTLTFDAVQARVSRPVSIVGTQLVLAVSVLLAHQLIAARTTAVYYGLVIWLEACALFSITLFFSFAGDYFAPRDARRLYGFIVGGMPLGTIVAGQAIRLAVGHVEAEDLLYGAAAVLAVNAVLASLIFRTCRPVAVEPMDAASTTERVALRPLFDRPYVRLLSALTVLSLVTYVTVDYQMKWIASALDERSLARFFGGFYAWVGVAQTVFQLALSQRLLRRFGIITSLTVLPVLIGAASLLAYVGSFGGHFGFGALGFAAGVNFLRMTLAETLDLPSRELLYLPLPARLRQRLQPLLSGALAPLSQGLGGLFMLTALWLGVGVETFSLLAATSAALLVVVLVRLRPRYRETLAATLRDHLLDATDLEQVMQSPTAERLIEGLLRSSDPEVARATIDLLAGRKLGALSRTLLELSSGQRDDVAVAALQRLVQERDALARQAIDGAWRSPSAPRRQAAVLALCELEGPEAVSRVSSALGAADDLMRSSAVIGLARFCGADGQSLVRPDLERLVDDDDPEQRAEAARVLGRIAASGFGDLWSRLLADRDGKVRAIALEACAQVGDPLLVQPLLEGVAHAEQRAACVRALRAMPRSAVPAIAAALASEQRTAAERCAIASTLGHVGGADAGVALWACARSGHELTLRLAAALGLRALLERPAAAEAAAPALPGYDELVEGVCASIVLLRRAQAELAELDTFVAGLFGDHAALELELLCALLSLRHDRRTIDRIRYNLVVEPREVAQRVLELLDELLPRRLAGPVIAAAQAWLDDRRAAPGLSTDTQARLMADDGWLRVATVHHLNQGAAYPTIAAASLSDLDRDLYRLLDVVSFLKRVPLFEGLAAYYLREQAEVAEFRALAAGETLFARGDVGDAMYIVCRGQIDVRIGERTIASLTSGASMGELALLDGEPRSASAVSASDDTLLLRLPAERFRGLLFSQPFTVRALLRTLDRRIRETQGGELSGASAPPPEARRSLLMRAQKLGLAELVSTMSFLRGVELFGDLSSGDLANVAGIAQEVVLYDGDRLFEEGDPGESLYLVCSGRVEITVGERRVAVLERNACLGEMALISGLPRSATATALAESRLLRIGAEDFDSLLSAEPSIAFALLRTLSRRLRDALAKRDAAGR